VQKKIIPSKDKKSFTNTSKLKEFKTSFIAEFMMLGDSASTVQNLPSLPEDIKQSTDETLSKFMNVDVTVASLSHSNKSKRSTSAKPSIVPPIISPGIPTPPTIPTIPGTENAFSTIGVLEIFKQRFCIDNRLPDPMPGPIEHVFTIGPFETVEVRQETTLKKSFEQSQESSTSSSLEKTSEDRRSEELTSRFMESYQQSTSSSISANVSGSYAFISAGISGSKSWSEASNNARERSSRNVQDAMRRTVDSYNKSFSVRVRSAEEFEETNTYRKVVQNIQSSPINYGLFRYFQRLVVKHQRVAKQLAWHFVVENPANFLLSGELVSRNRVSPDLVQFHSERSTLTSLWNGSGNPEPGSFVSAVAATKKSNSSKHIVKSPLPTNWTEALMRGFEVSVHFEFDPSRRILGTGFTENLHPSMLQTIVDSNKIEITDTFAVTRSVRISSSGTKDRYAVMVRRLKKSPNIGSFDSAANERIFQYFLEKIFVRIVTPMTPETDKTEQYASYITESLTCVKRPSAELRREESRAIQKVIFDRLKIVQTDAVERATLIEVLKARFDLDKAIYLPTESPGTVATSSVPYDIVQGQAQRFGASLGWQLQPDVDLQRIEFLNSRSIRIVVPIKAGEEELALKLLSDVGQISGDVTKISNEIKQLRAVEQFIAKLGLVPDDVSIDTVEKYPTPDPIGTDIETVFPILKTLEYDVPIPGFAYKVLGSK
jgi:hypothetical protein